MNKTALHIALVPLMFIIMGISMPAAAQFSIGPGGFVTVKQGGTLMIDMELHIKSDATGSGYLVDQTTTNDVTITGDALVERYMTPDVWHNAASPVSNENTAVYPTELVFWYNEALILNDWNFGWVWYTGATGGPLMVFRGYDVLFFTNPVTVNYQATGAENVNTGSYSIGVIITNSVPGEVPLHKGWNLLGNPYPSPVDWLAAGWNKSPINDAKYIWDGANDVYTTFVGGGAPFGLNGGTRFIPSNQGFWVQALVSGNVGIANTTRVGDITGTPDYYKLDPVDYPLVSLSARDSGHDDEAVVRFIDGTTEGFDRDYDATKLFSLNPEVPQLSIKYGKQAFALNTLPEIRRNMAVTVGFRSTREGIYEIRLNPRTRLDDETEIYLVDELLRVSINLEKDSVYTFFHDPANEENRFRLYFNPYEDVINNLEPGSWFTVYSNGNALIILRNTNREVNGEIRVCNMLGQPVYKARLPSGSKAEFQLAVPAGYYIASILTDQNITNTKIFMGGF